MGGHDFECTAQGKTAKEAYKNAVEQAEYDYGHEAYNGTISTTDGFKMMPPMEIVHQTTGGSCRRMETAGEHMLRVLNHTEKWGKAACWPDPHDPALWHFAGWAAS